MEGLQGEIQGQGNILQTMQQAIRERDRVATGESPSRDVYLF